MSIKVVCSMKTLMTYAHELGQARLSKDPERIKAAKEQFDSYKKLCLEADELHLGMTYSDLSGR